MSKDYNSRIKLYTQIRVLCIYFFESKQIYLCYSKQSNYFFLFALSNHGLAIRQNSFVKEIERRHKRKTQKLPSI